MNVTLTQNQVETLVWLAANANGDGRFVRQVGNGNDVNALDRKGMIELAQGDGYSYQLTRAGRDVIRENPELLTKRAAMVLSAARRQVELRRKQLVIAEAELALREAKYGNPYLHMAGQDEQVVIRQRPY